MSVDINWLAVVLATASSMVVGSVWYARPVFGNMWMKLAHLKPETVAGKGAAQAIIATLIVSFLTAYILAHFIFLSHAYFNGNFMQDALVTAFWAWLGLTAARFITHDAFERRPVALTALNCVHELVTLLVMGLIIGLFPTA